MYKIAVCDDVSLFAEMIRELIDEFFSENEMDYDIDMYCRGEDLLRGLEENTYNMLFLDIELGDMNGVELAKEIRKYNDEMLISFITSYREFSCSGYKVNAFRYIIKEKTQLRSFVNECLSSALRLYDVKNQKRLLKFREEAKFVQINEIVYIESNGHDLIFHIKEGNTSVNII